MIELLLLVSWGAAVNALLIAYLLVRVRRLEALTRAILDKLSRETPPDTGI